MMPCIVKKPTQDGTFTVYVEATAVAWGLTHAAADDLIDRLRRAPHAPHAPHVAAGRHCASPAGAFLHG